ncbi:MAG: AsmA family protein, partial [bacterium]
MDKSPKKHPILSIVYRILGGIAILLIVLAIGLKLYFTPDRVKSLAENLIKQSFNRETKIGSFDLSLFRGLVAKDIQISNLPGFSTQPVLTIKELNLHYNLWSMIRKKPKIYKITVRDPVLSIEKNKEGNWNFTDLLQSKLKEYQLDRIEIINAALLVHPYPEINISKTNITLQDIRPWKPWKFDIQGIFAEQPESRIALSGALNVFTLIPTGDINISVKNLNPIPMIKARMPGTKLDQLSLLSDAYITISSPQSKPINITGSISASKIQHPILPRYLGNGRVAFTLSVSPDSGEIAVPSVTLNLDGFPELTATGNIESFYGESTIQFAVQGKDSNLQPLLAIFGKPYPSISGTGNIRLTHGDIFMVPSRNIVRVDSGISLSNLKVIDTQIPVEVHNGTMDIGLTYISPTGIRQNPMRIYMLANAEKILVKDISIKPDPVIVKLEFDRNLVLAKLAIPSTKLMAAEVPISIQATGDKKKYLAKIMMHKFVLALIPESLLTKTGIPKTNGVAAGNLEITYIPSLNTSLSAKGNIKIDNLSIAQNNKSYALGDIESDFDSLVNITNHTISIKKLSIKSDRNLAIQGNAELQNYGRDNISGQVSIAPVSIPDLKSYFAIVAPSSDFPVLEGTFAGKGSFTYHPATQFNRMKLGGSLDLTGTAIKYRNASASASVKAGEITLSFANKEPDILYSKATILFKGFELQDVNNTILGDLHGTAEIDTDTRFSQITGILSLDSTNIDIPSSKIMAKDILGKARFAMNRNSSIDTKFHNMPITGQIDILQIGELVNPWIETKNISITGTINPEKMSIDSLQAQVEGGSLESRAELNLIAKPTVYLKGKITNIKSADILQQINAVYPIPYHSTAGTISAEFDVNERRILEDRLVEEHVHP